MNNLGARVYGLAAVMMGVAALLWGDFVGLIPAPWLPAHVALASLDGTLLIAGGQDIVFPAFLAKAIAARLPCADAQVIPESGHSPYFEQAATFHRLVESFLALHH